MENILDKIGNIANETYQYTAKKTSKIAKETKLKMQMNEKKSDINEIYEKIGKLVYQKHLKQEDAGIDDKIDSYLYAIDKLSDKIEKIRMELLNLKDKKQCKNCYAQIDILDNYCSNCGASQQKSENKKEEIVQILENIDIPEEKQNEAQQIQDNLEQQIEQENLE